MIVELLREEGLTVKVSAVCRLLKKYKESGSFARRPGLFNSAINKYVSHIAQCTFSVSIIY